MAERIVSPNKIRRIKENTDMEKKRQNQKKTIQNTGEQEGHTLDARTAMQGEEQYRKKKRKRSGPRPATSRGIVRQVTCIPGPTEKKTQSVGKKKKKRRRKKSTTEDKTRAKKKGEGDMRDAKEKRQTYQTDAKKGQNPERRKEGNGSIKYHSPTTGK